MLVIGITGGVGTGKTRILEYLAANTNSEIILADQVANRLKEPGEKCHEAVAALLGRNILNPDGSINKEKMAGRIFGNPVLLRKVNEIIRPAVMEYILGRKDELDRQGKIKVLFIEAALLIEGGYLPYLDELWYIYSKKEVRIRRLKEARNYSEEKTESIMACQLTEEQFRNSSHVVIDNSGSFEETSCRLKEECVRLNIWEDK